jgi:hypothetical protein
VKDLRSITDPAAGSEARRQEGPEAAHCLSGFEPMTLRQLLLRDGVGGPAPARSARGQFRCSGAKPAGYRLPPGTAATSRVARMPFAEPSVRRSHQPIGGVIRCSGS